MLNAPCKDCTERHMNCHADCIKYKNWRAEYDEYARKIAEKQRADICIAAEKKAVIHSRRNKR